MKLDIRSAMAVVPIPSIPAKSGAQEFKIGSIAVETLGRKHAAPAGHEGLGA